MRTVDVVLAFPQLVFALLLVSIIGPKVWIIVLAVGISHAPQVARVLRAATLDISERDFVKAIELEGVSPARVMASEILPNLVTPLMVEAGLRLTYSIVIMAGLSFLGFGIPPPAASWGIMINENRIGLESNLWGVVAPAILIALLTIGTNTFTDAIARVSLGIERRDELPGHLERSSPASDWSASSDRRTVLTGEPPTAGPVAPPTAPVRLSVRDLRICLAGRPSIRRRRRGELRRRSGRGARARRRVRLRQDHCRLGTARSRPARVSPSRPGRSCSTGST